MQELRLKKKATIECSIAKDLMLDVVKFGDCRSELEVNCSVVCEEVPFPEECAYTQSG